MEMCERVPKKKQELLSCQCSIIQISIIFLGNIFMIQRKLTNYIVITSFNICDYFHVIYRTQKTFLEQQLRQKRQQSVIRASDLQIGATRSDRGGKDEYVHAYNGKKMENFVVNNKNFTNKFMHIPRLFVAMTKHYKYGENVINCSLTFSFMFIRPH